MAAAFTIGKHPWLYEIGTAEVQVTISDPTKVVTCYHTGKDSAGAASTGDVFIKTTSATVATTYANGEGKIPLQVNVSVPIPEQVTDIYLKTASGNVSVLFVAAKRQHQ